MLDPEKLVVGQLYYMVRYEDAKLTRPVIGSYTYKGTADKNSKSHCFLIVGSDEHLFLEEQNLDAVVDLPGLLEELGDVLAKAKGKGHAS